MTAPQQNQTTQSVPAETKPNDKELNFRALEAKLQQERAARLEAEKKALEAEKKAQQVAYKETTQDEDDDDGIPYIDKKKFDKTLNKFGQSTQSEIQKAMEQAKIAAKEELKQELWLENNPDFYDVLQHANKFAEKAPRLAESILRMPDTFERQKLVYENIKQFGLDKPEQKQSSIQEKIDANKRSPYYQPSGVANAPYSTAGDFSPAGQKNAYAKMKELKDRLRLG